MNSGTQGLKLTYLSACLASLFIQQAIAADEQSGSQNVDQDSTIETLSIVGSRQAYQGNFSPLETPQSELRINSEALANAGAIDLNQALDLSASVSRQNNFGGLWNSFSLRGFVGDENLPSNYLVNGFNAGRGFGGSRDLSGIESVEVLKGPRAALFGRGEPGGTVNLVTKRPTFDTTGEIKISAGSYDTYRADLDYTTPLSDDVAVRFVGFYEDAGSFRDTVKSKKEGFSPSIAWEIDDQSTLVYELEYAHQEVPFDRGVLAIDNKLGVIPQSRFLGEPADGPIETDALGHQVEFHHDFDDNWSLLLGANYRDTSLEGFATETGFAGVVDDEVNRFRRYRKYDAEYQVFRAELSGSLEVAGIEHRLILGVDSDKFDNDQFALRDRTTEQYINIYNPVYSDADDLANDFSTQIDRLETQESLGVFIQDQISITDKLDVRIGARFDDYMVAIKKVWSGEVVEHESDFLSWHGFKSYPLPEKKAKTPIIIGGNAGKVFQRIARYGDGWFIPPMPMEQLPKQLKKLHEECKKEGRTSGAIELTTLWDPSEGSDALKVLYDLGVSRVVSYNTGLDGIKEIGDTYIK